MRSPQTDRRSLIANTRLPEHWCLEIHFTTHNAGSKWWIHTKTTVWCLCCKHKRRSLAESSWRAFPWNEGEWIGCSKNEKKKATENIKTTVHMTHENLHCIIMWFGKTIGHKSYGSFCGIFGGQSTLLHPSSMHDKRPDEPFKAYFTAELYSFNTMIGAVSARQRFLGQSPVIHDLMKHFPLRAWCQHAIKIWNCQ